MKKRTIYFLIGLLGVVVALASVALASMPLFIKYLHYAVFDEWARQPPGSASVIAAMTAMVLLILLIIACVMGIVKLWEAAGRVPPRSSWRP